MNVGKRREKSQWESEKTIGKKKVERRKYEKRKIEKEDYVDQ